MACRPAFSLRGRGVNFVGRRKLHIRSGLGGGHIATLPDPRLHKAHLNSSEASRWSSRFRQRQEDTIGSGLHAFEAFGDMSAVRRHVLRRPATNQEPA